MERIRNWLKLYFKETDKLLFLLSFIVSAIGALMVYSATRYKMNPGELHHDVKIMILVSVVGLLLCIFISFIDYEFIVKMWPLIAIFCLALMLVVFKFGVAPPARPDAKTWLRIGSAENGITFQPSELLKIGFIITFAVHIDYIKKDEVIKSFKQVLLLGLHGAIPVLMVMKSGDDGSALIFLLMFVGMMYAAGVHWGYFVAGLTAIGVAFPAVWALGDKFLLNQSQKNRFLAVIYPELYAQNEALQQIRGIEAIGSGGFFGSGLFKGAYTQNGRVPESQNDFIFTVVCEELGFIGAVVVIGLLIAIIVRIIINGKKSNDTVSYIMCAGMASMMASQMIINIGMCLQLIPVIGITLPLLSAGGSSSLCIYIGIGLMMSIYRFNQKTPVSDFRYQNIVSKPNYRY